MTRINVVPPHTLHSKHLLAEYRELPRVFTLARRAMERGDMGNIPEQYTLGQGHVRFFYDKLAWLSRRWSHLKVEMHLRGYKMNSAMLDSVSKTCDELTQSCLWGDWTPTVEAYYLNSQRILERLRTMKGES